MNKKSQMQLSLLFQLILVTLIVLSVLGATNKIRDQTFFQQKSFSKNVGLFYDAVASSPGRTEVTYRIYPDYNLDVEINENCLVKVFKELKSPSLFNCALNIYSDTHYNYQENFITIIKNA